MERVEASIQVERHQLCDQKRMAEQIDHRPRRYCVSSQIVKRPRKILVAIVLPFLGDVSLAKLRNFCAKIVSTVALRAASEAMLENRGDSESTTESPIHGR